MPCLFFLLFTLSFAPLPQVAVPVKQLLHTPVTLRFPLLHRRFLSTGFNAEDSVNINGASILFTPRSFKCVIKGLCLIKSNEVGRSAFTSLVSLRSCNASWTPSHIFTTPQYIAMWYPRYFLTPEYFMSNPSNSWGVQDPIYFSVIWCNKNNMLQNKWGNSTAKNVCGMLLLVLCKPTFCVCREGCIQEHTGNSIWFVCMATKAEVSFCWFILQNQREMGTLFGA